MQSITFNKDEALEKMKKPIELAKKEALETQDNVHTTKCEFEVIKVKGLFEETFLRFPHIASKIFEILEVQSLSKCQEVSKCWQNFIYDTKPFYTMLENYTSIPKLMLKKSLKDYDFQTIQQVANCASLSHKKAVNATISLEKPPLTEPKGSSLLYYILSERKLSDSQFLLVKLMLLNKMDGSTAMSTSLENQEAVSYRFALSKLMAHVRHEKFGKAYTTFKHMVVTKGGKWGSIWSWITILHIAVAKNHLSICKVIFKQVQTIGLLHSWGRIVLQLATFLGYKDICEFIIDEIQFINPFAYEGGENLIEMANRLGHFEIRILLEQSWARTLNKKLM